MSQLPVSRFSTFFLDFLSPWKVAVLFFFMLLCVNAPHLFNPPYWDDVLGLHSQAIFIARHNFNPNVFRIDREIQKKQPNIHRSMVYPYSIVPWIHAVFYRCLSPRSAHFAGHVFNISCLSVAAALAYAILKRRKGTALFALLITGLAFLDPVLSGQTASLGQECPMIAMTMLAVHFLSMQKYKCALAIAILALFIRPIGIALLLSILGLFFYRFIRNWKSYSERQRMFFIFFLYVILLTAGLLLFIHRDLLNICSENFFLTRFDRLARCFMYFALEAVAATAAALFLLRDKSLRSLDEDSQFHLVILGFILILFSAMNLFDTTLPRYVAFAILPTFVLIAEALPTKAKLFFPIVSLTALFLFFHPMLNLHPYFQRSGEYLERSRRYLKDLRTTQEVCKLIATHIPREIPVLVKFPFGQLLTMPEFGYVDKPLPNIYLVSDAIPSQAPVKQIRTQDPLPVPAVCLFTASSLSPDARLQGPQSPTDHLLWQDNTIGLCILYYMTAPHTTAVKAAQATQP